MSSTIFEIKWIDGVKRCGLFAKKDIAMGTKILEEQAVLIDTSKIAQYYEIRARWTDEVKTLSKTTRRQVKLLTEVITRGMQTFQDNTKDDPRYEFATAITQQRLNNDTINDPDVENLLLKTVGLFMPLKFYMQVLNVKPTEISEEATLASLRSDLQPINVFLQGCRRTLEPSVTGWNAHTRFINHGCKPTANLSFSNQTVSDNTNGTMGTVALYAILDVQKDEEITIEYEPVFGEFHQRRIALEYSGIVACTCNHCVHEENVAQRAEKNDEAAIAEHKALQTFGRSVNTIIIMEPLEVNDPHPASFYQTLWTTLVVLKRDGYNGSIVFRHYVKGMEFARKYNDNVRIYYFTQAMLRYVTIAFSTSHEVHQKTKNAINVCFANHRWNPTAGYRDHLTLCLANTHFQDEDESLIFMKDKDSSSEVYHLLTVTPEGRPAPISLAENLKRVRAAEDVAVEKAEEARADLVEELEEEEAKRARELAKKAAKKEKQRAKKAAATAAALPLTSASTSPTTIDAAAAEEGTVIVAVAAPAKEIVVPVASAAAPLAFVAPAAVAAPPVAVAVPAAAARLAAARAAIARAVVVPALPRLPAAAVFPAAQEEEKEVEKKEEEKEEKKRELGNLAEESREEMMEHSLPWRFPGPYVRGENLLMSSPNLPVMEARGRWLWRWAEDKQWENPHSGRSKSFSK